MNALMLFMMLQTAVFPIDGDHNIKKCLPAMRDAIKATRSAWAPRPQPPSTSFNISDWSNTFSCGYWTSDTTFVPETCCNLSEPARLRCRADELDRKEAEKKAQAAKEAAAIAALDRVDETCGEMK